MGSGLLLTKINKYSVMYLAMNLCPCQTPATPASQFVSTTIGTDVTNGRFGEVSLETCQHCHRVWLRYFVEYEDISQSGRWFRGELKPEQAVVLLEQMDTVLHGGSYFINQPQAKKTVRDNNTGLILVDR